MARITLSILEQQLRNFVVEAQRYEGNVSFRDNNSLKAGALFIHTESGFWQIRQLTHDNRTVCSRLFSGSLRECSTYLEGMMAALHLIKPA